MSEVKALLESLYKLKRKATKESGAADAFDYHVAMYNALPTLRAYIERLERDAEAGRVLAAEIASSYFTQDPQEEHLCENCKEDHAFTASKYIHGVLKGFLTDYRSAIQDLASKE